MKALIVDDEKVKANLINEWLMQYGFTTTICNSYVSAIETAKCYFDLLVIDYYLNDEKTGLDFIKEYKKNYSPNTVILYTAYRDQVPNGIDAKEFDEIHSILDMRFKKKARESVDSSIEEKVYDLSKDVACLQVVTENQGNVINKLTDNVDTIVKKFSQVVSSGEVMELAMKTITFWLKLATIIAGIFMALMSWKVFKE